MEGRKASFAAIPMPAQEAPLAPKPIAAPTVAKFLLLTAAVFFFFLLNGLVAEKLFKGVPGFYPYGWFLTLVQFVVYASVSWVKLKCTHAPVRSGAPPRTFAAIAFFTVATSGLSNASVGFMNYPTQLMFKSCKVIPVMIAGIFIQGKRYSPMEFGSMLTMTLGLIFFSQADQAVSPNFQFKGICMVSLALCADAIIGNLQEKVMKQYSIGNDELIVRTYSIGITYILVILIASGELFEAFGFCNEHAREVYPLMLLFSLTAYVGFNFVLVFIKTFGAVTTVTVTTCRKALTICLSFLLFAKPFTPQYVWSGLLVVLGIYINICAKRGLSLNPLLPLAQATLRQFQVARQRRRSTIHNKAFAV